MSSLPADGPRLSAPVADLVNGADLDRKVGVTILLTAADRDGWPRQALLSVGEVLSLTGQDIRLALYGGSRTTQALTGAGKGLLTAVADETCHKICVDVARVHSHDGSLALFAGRVVAVDQDRVGYATITGGIAYELPNPEHVVARWRRQLEQLRAVEA